MKIASPCTYLTVDRVAEGGHSEEGNWVPKQEQLTWPPRWPLGAAPPPPPRPSPGMFFCRISAPFPLWIKMVVPFPSGSKVEYLIHSLWLKMRANGKKLWNYGYFPCLQPISALYNLYLAGEMGLFSSNSENATSVDETVHSSLLLCHF